jgi:hypothetical protein
MLQSPSDLGFDQESPAAYWFVSISVEDLLECHFTVQFGIVRNEHLPKASFSVLAQETETLAVRRRIANGGTNSRARVFVR